MDSIANELNSNAAVESREPELHAVERNAKSLITNLVLLWQLDASDTQRMPAVSMKFFSAVDLIME
jgi:hypothetical protein